MKERFNNWNPNPETAVRLRQVLDILAEYKKLDIRLTLRQLYYQLVSRDIIKENTTQEYKKLGSLLANARLAGIVDWDVIEDRVRRPEKHSEWDSVPDLVKSAVASYRLPRWKDQENYVELWCEKDALRSVLEPITDDLHITFMVNRGYSSISAMYESSKRIIAAMEQGKTPYILYLGDLDPSGEDMVNDIRKRMKLLQADGSHDYPADTEEDEGYPRYADLQGERIILEVRKIALTPAQVRQYRPPHNMAKQTDSRYKAFREKHGKHSYEVDALKPQVMIALVRGEIEGLMDMDLFNAWIKKENAGKKRLVAAARSIK